MEGVGLLVPVLAATAVVAVLALLAALSRKRSTEDASRAYLAGVRYVLSDEPDAAIAELSRAAQLNTGTTETYFALAALMRRKGELAWAIRLGQNMLLKPQLQPEVRRRARLELALDYRRAGMQDRSRETFEALVADAAGAARGAGRVPAAARGEPRLGAGGGDPGAPGQGAGKRRRRPGPSARRAVHGGAGRGHRVGPARSPSAPPPWPRTARTGSSRSRRVRLACGDARGARWPPRQAVAREPETAAQGYALALEAGSDARGVRAVARRAGGAARENGRCRCRSSGPRR